MGTALVVGGSSGIGLATARLLAAAGDDVHIAARDRARLDAAVAGVPGLVPHRVDAADAAGVRAVLAAVGTLDRLVLTQGGNDGVGPFDGLDLAGLRRGFDVKYWGMVTTIQAAIPTLAPDASITLVGAISARIGMPGTAGIGSLNAAVEGLVQPLAAELAPVRVNAVSPGYVDTPWWDFVPQDEREQTFAQVAPTLPTRRIASADDIAQAIVFLAGNPNVTGTVLETDGGARLNA